MLMLINIPVLWQYLALLALILIFMLASMCRCALQHRSPSSFWQQEDYLAFPGDSEFRRKIGLFFLYSAIFFYILKTTMRACTLYHADWVGTPEQFNAFVESFYDISLILTLIRFFFFTRFSWKQLSLACLFLFPFFLSHIITQDPSYLLEFLLILSVKGEDLHRLLKFFLPVLLACSLCVLAMYFAGLLPVDSTGGALVEEKRNRFALGFIHPNILSLYVAALNWGWILLRWHKLRWWEWATIAALNYGVYLLTDSRSMFYSVAASELAALVLHLVPRFFRSAIWAWLSALIPPIMAVLSLLPCYYFDSSNPVWAKINSLFSGRPYLFLEAWKKSGWSWFGMDASSGDSLFNFMQIERGFFCWVLFIVMYSVLLFVLCRHHCWAEFTVALGLLGICFTEKTPLALTVNLTFWLISNLVTLSPWEKWNRFSIPREQD